VVVMAHITVGRPAVGTFNPAPAVTIVTNPGGRVVYTITAPTTWTIPA
jgi:hypothetical protein